MNKSEIRAEDNNDVFVPKLDPTFTPFGYAEDLDTIIENGSFFPVFVSGESGIGKTFMAKQVCAMNGRKFCRVNITTETDEDDLLGGFRLINGNTVFHYGPVIQAMKEGAVLLLDELPLASDKIMCLQSILEGEGVFIKKLGEWVTPTEGFTAVATGNTKGRGSSDGKFIFNNILDDAMLERFYVNFEHGFPPSNVEIEILRKVCSGIGLDATDKTGTAPFIRSLIRWAGMLRKSYLEGQQMDCINTRRLISILKSYAVFKDTHKAVKLGITKFDPAVQEAFISSFKSVETTIDEEDDLIVMTTDGQVKKRSNQPW